MEIKRNAFNKTTQMVFGPKRTEPLVAPQHQNELDNIYEKDECSSIGSMEGEAPSPQILQTKPLEYYSTQAQSIKVVEGPLNMSNLIVLQG